MPNWQAILVEPAKTILAQIGQFMASALLVIIILIVGWLVSNIIKAIVIKVLKTVKIDSLSETVKLDTLLAKGGISNPLSELVGIICYWLAILVTLVVAINALGLTVAAELLNRVILYVPNIIIAIFILISGMFVAALLNNIVQTAANNAGVSQSKLFGKIVEVVVVIFAVAISLEQLKIGARVIELAIGIILASIGLAAAIAFGFGCKDIAAKFLSNLIDNLKSKK